MKWAIVSDIHGNLTALKEVLMDSEKQGVDVCLSLGDNVGYGPEPEGVTDILQQESIVSIMGNHELALSDERYLEWFNLLAKTTVILTRQLMSQASLDYCEKLPLSIVVNNCLLVHGCPPSSPLRYIFEPPDSELIELIEEMEQPICFVGHTHGLEIIQYDEKSLQRIALPEGETSLSSERRYIINVGSVGQPRDQYNKHAKYVIYDDRRYTIEVRFVPYDVASTTSKLRQMGWPEFLAQRLE
jgi:predicted phosphodiesterase